MTTFKGIKASRVLHYLFMALTAGAALMLLLNLAAYFGIAGERPFIRGWVTTLADRQDPVAMPFPGGLGDVRMYKFEENKLVMLEFNNLSGIMQARYLAYLFLQNMAWVLAIYVLYQLMRIFRNLDRGQVFRTENTGRIRRIAVAVFLFPHMGYWASRILGVVAAEATGFTANLPLVTSESVILGALVALVIYALVEIFQSGAQLQQEQDLTI